MEKNLGGLQLLIGGVGYLELHATDGLVNACAVVAHELSQVRRGEYLPVAKYMYSIYGNLAKCRQNTRRGIPSKREATWSCREKETLEEGERNERFSAR